MKKTIFIALAFITAVAMFNSCDDEADNVGIQIQPDMDKLSVGTDTFHLTTETFPVKHITSKSDSLLLGTYVDKFIGELRGDVLTEFILPTIGFTYLPDNEATTIPDSVVLTLYFNSSFGEQESPLNISVYELKDSLNRTVEYPTDLDVKDFVDYSKKVGSCVMSVSDPQTKKRTSSVDITLSKDFLNRFYTNDPQIFKSQDAFKKFFNGLYITTTDFGSATMLVVSSLKLRLNYHYFYNDKPKSIITSYHDFWANQEVKRVNHLLYSYRIPTATSEPNFSVLASPGNYYTRVRIPLERMRQRVGHTGRELDINKASLRLDVLDRGTYKLQSKLPYVSDLMLIKESQLETFFEKHLLPSDTSAFIAPLKSTAITARTFKYHYTFDKLATLLENEIKNDSTGAPYLDMILLPVAPEYKVLSQGQSVITGVNQNMNLQATKVYSGMNDDVPMKIEVLYSEF